MRHTVWTTRVRALRWIVGVITTAVAGCSGDATGPGAGTVESIVVTPATATVSVNSNLTLAAEAFDAAGTELESTRITWSTADASIADVTQSGVVTGHKVGTVLIAASARGKDAFARITVNPTPVASVRVSPTQRSLTVGQTTQLTAETLDAANQVLAGRPVTWTTSNAAVATVTQGGLVTAVAPGAVFITAAAEGKSDAASVTVSLVPVASVRLTPTSKDLFVGQTAQLSASPLDANGVALAGRTVTWSSNRTSVATVTSDGLVIAVSSGTATITATSEGRSASATINVSPRPATAVIVSPSQITIFAGQSAQLGAQVTDDRGQVISGQPISFSSADPQVATVTSQGMVTGVAQGTATITATSGSISGTATVTIAPDPVAVVDVSPTSTTIYVGQPVQLTATPRNISGQPLTGRTVTWSSVTPSLASVSSSGLVTSLAAGNAVIVATVDGIQGSAAINIRQVPVASVTVSPSPASVVVGQTLTLSATTKDGSGNTLLGRVVGWASSDNSIATVSATGMVTGIAAGSATITATSEGQSGTTVVTVTQVPVATVAVTPSTATIDVGNTVSLGATTTDASGNVLTGRVVTWSSSATNIASVSGTGVVTGVSAGTATITATSEGRIGTAVVTVTTPPAPQVASVTVSPATLNLAVGGSSTLTATAKDPAGNPMPATFTWSSSNTSVATVNSSGKVTAIAPGSATITASSGTASGTASVTVSPGPIHHIVVTPTNPSIKVGQTVQLTATVYDANNNVIPGVTVTWSSADPTKASVSSTGVVSGLRKGTVDITASAGGKSGKTSVRVE